MIRISPESVQNLSGYDRFFASTHVAIDILASAPAQPERLPSIWLLSATNGVLRRSGKPYPNFGVILKSFAPSTFW
ncbi:MAG TPA: hypothetical protein V6D12_24060 [Candidatus Obscuribacterales bacterium]